VSLQFLLDTSTFSLAIAKQPSQPINEMLRKHSGEIAISSTVWHELQFGVQLLPQSKRRTELENYYSKILYPSVPILAYDHHAADWHALERARLASIGLMSSFADGQIAAVAAVHELTLVTANVKHFEGFQGVEVVNWLEDG